MPPLATGPVIERIDRRIRVVFGKETLVDSRDVKLVFAGPRRFPAYYFPLADVRQDFLQPSDRRVEHPDLGSAVYWTVSAGGRSAANAAWGFKEPAPGAEAVKDHATFRWSEMDAWFEEDEEVFVHPRDPYHRVDVLNSSRHVRVEIDGVTVAESTRPWLLYETGLPTRYYLPKLDVRMDLLEATDSHTRCPYKGIASYWSVRAGDKTYEDLVWSYPAPIPECPKIENLLCFYNEKVDLYVDGVLQERPQSPWS